MKITVKCTFISASQQCCRGGLGEREGGVSLGSGPHSRGRLALTAPSREKQPLPRCHVDDGCHTRPTDGRTSFPHDTGTSHGHHWVFFRFTRSFCLMTWIPDASATSTEGFWSQHSAGDSCFPLFKKQTGCLVLSAAGVRVRSRSKVHEVNE